MQTDFAHVSSEGRDLRLEYAWLNGAQRDAPLLVFLHEALGTLAMWRDFPQRLCDAAAVRGLVFSRYGYGGSTARPPRELWPLDYLEREGRQLLPEFLRAVGAPANPWLFGHSDGASIALIYAAAFPESLAGAVVLAPHIFVEDATIAGVATARRSYETTDLRQRLARYHRDPDDAFWRWHDRWIDPAFRNWNIEGLLPAIRCPLLAIQGEGDEYATMAQLDGLKRRVPQAELVKLAGCRHSPHRDQPQQVMDAVVRQIRRAGRLTPI
jgi:pimeloyl-ACP methyl ester carboxylesterase